MPPGLIDVISPFLGYSEVAGVDYRRAIFIFLSNTGGTEINRLTHDFWRSGKERSHIVMKDMETLINRGAFNERGGFSKSDIMAKNMIDFYIPFLPLERKHVILCIRDYAAMKNRTDLTDDFYQRVANEMEYFPPDLQLYSRTGCKRVQKKVDVMLTD